MSTTATPAPDRPRHPVGYVEVTLALALVAEDGHLSHGAMVDTTVAFYVPAAPPPRELTQEETFQTLMANLPRIAAAVQAALLMNGLVDGGSIDDPMILTKGQTVGRQVTEPLRVHVRPVREARA